MDTQNSSSINGTNTGDNVIPSPVSGLTQNFDQNQLAITNFGLTLSSYTTTLANMDTRVSKLERQQKPINSFFRSSRRLSLIASFALIGTPLLLVITFALFLMLTKPDLTSSRFISIAFSALGITAFVEIIAVPIWVKNINDKLNKLIEKNYPDEDL